MKENISHQIKHRKVANDEFYTPAELCKLCINQFKFKDNETLLESAYGTGNFFKEFPLNTINEYSKDFFNVNKNYDWIITNPPYSILDNWFKQTIKLSNKGFGLLIGWNNLTARRIEMANKENFGITKILMFKVFKWYGMSCFVIFEKDKPNIIDINRKVWREDSLNN